MSPFENVIIGSSFEEIVFSNRNKEYGAYELRKKQKRYLFIAFFISFLMVGSTVITPFILNHNKGSISGKMVSGPTVIIMDSTLIFDPPKPPDIQIEPMANRFVPPLVVDSIDNSDPILGSIDELLDIPQNNEPPTNIVAIVENDPVIIVEERPFVTVEIPAQFEGGDLYNFNKWVIKNIEYPQIAVENGIIGKVYVQFVVNSKGKVENVTILRGADPALNQEAIRVIESSPKWSAPLQGGKPVKQLFTIPVNFKLEQ